MAVPESSHEELSGRLVQIVTTVSTLEEARTIARTLLDEYRVACVQIDGPIESHYRWQGNLELSNEFRLTAKTTMPLAVATMRAIRELHSYDVPEVLVLPVIDSSATYAHWVGQQLVAPSKLATMLDAQKAEAEGASSSFAIYLYGPAWGAMDVTFEHVAEQLRNCERLYFEDDGSFVWTGDDQGGRWQLDGMVYDAAGRVQYIDLKGRCPASHWRRLVQVLSDAASLSSPATSAMPRATAASGAEAPGEDFWKTGVPGGDPQSLSPIGLIPLGLGSRFTVLQLPGQQRKTLEQFTQEIWKQSE